MNSIGGYFSLEIDEKGRLFHDSALALNSGRNCLEHILVNNRFSHIYIPYYTCDVILEPIKKLGISFSYYNINESFMPILENMNHNSAILFTNYYGLMSKNIQKINNKYPNLIIDNSQAFYDLPIKNVPTFYSPRKFFGVSDGGFVYNSSDDIKYDFDVSVGRFSHLINSIDFSKENSYKEFKKNDDDIIGQPILKMSKLTKKVLSGINYEDIKSKRVENFNFLHTHLKSTNRLTPIIDNSGMVCPMVYPYLSDSHNMVELREKLILEKIYTAQYWSNVLKQVATNTIEYRFVRDIIHLPIDQRYNEKEMKYILNCINK